MQKLHAEGALRFIHRLVFRSTPQLDAVLAEVGLARTKKGGIFEELEVFEDDPRWAAFEPTIIAMDLSDSVRTEFSPEEFGNAKWLRMRGGAVLGYPQPNQGARGYRQVTYDWSTSCEKCGAGHTQVAPFRMKKSPRWGRRSLGQLEWANDVYFATEMAYREVFADFGIESMPVLDSKGREPLDGVVQLVASDHHAEVDASRLESETCSDCGVPRSLVPSRGMFPRVVGKGDHLRLTDRHFGSGAASWRSVIVSQDLYSALTDSGVTGSFFTPCA